MYKHILLPTDGSTLSARAVASGIALARALDAGVTALFVAPPPTPVVFRRKLPIGYATTEQHADMIEHEAAKALGAVEKAAKAAGVAVRLEKVVGDFPADAILDTAKRRKCDLIVMASHGRSGLKAVLLGSETQKVLAHARVPVLVHR